ncbi:helix-turn-helix transcriptional regulator [Ensifer adhaerens]|uniref:helix-turn-helix transcriptional regulator n=1 Tax=Ensifer adhaerens TaxID=106592 RepID=UPI001C4E0904|nr:WYL domain-containing protein [Ensifer adhaerens]MBW0365848.1 WYL domain-containing protein [Ensifer adhaerens]UCM20247.1 WYL domain-containing protein [Ensifer adhaerens]
MSFEKALDLLELAEMARASHEGITLGQIRDRFDVSHRTAQRMTDALEAAFPHAILVTTDAERRNRWRIRGTTLATLALKGDRELAALYLAIAQLAGTGDKDTASNLQSLRDRLLAALPERTALRAEADAEALITAHGLLARPGPTAKYDPKISEIISEALRGPFRLKFTYRGKRRTVEPYGILVGTRRYLVARDPERADENLRRFRIDLIEEPRVVPESFPVPRDFSLPRHAMLGFGSYHAPKEHMETIWRFSAEAAPHACDWRFHPRQTAIELPDGRLEIRFVASGWVEMAWHLLQWGSHVEVLAPEGLRQLLEEVRSGVVEVFP